MKFILLLTIIIGMSLNGYTQTDFGNHSVKIPPLDTKVKAVKNTPPPSRFPTMSFPSIKTPSSSFSLNSDSKSSSLKQIGETATVNFMQKSEFKNPGDVIVEKLNKKEGQEVSQVFRRNQNLGDFKTKSTFIKILCRDYGEVDGDRIDIYINDLLIQSNIVLEGGFKEFELTLKSGFNKIDFEAINQGTSGPNTAEFRVYDDKGGIVSANQWNLATGFKATVIVVKE
jgi:hypothetical protein